MNKETKNEIKAENAADAVRKFITDIQVERIMERMGADVDIILGWLAHRAGNMELIGNREPDNLLMTIDNHRITLEFTDNCTEVVADDVEINVENLQEAVRRIVTHDHERMWTTAESKGDQA